MTELICPTYRPLLQLGSQGQPVKDLQQVINGRLDLLNIPTNLVKRLQIDGNFGPVTQQVVCYLQCLSFITVDGLVDAETWSALCEGVSRLPILSHGSTGTLVEIVQQVLQDLNYYDGMIDGIFGPLTQTAVKNYQTIHHLPSNGIIRPLIWEQLSKDYSYGSRCFPHIYDSIGHCQVNRDIG
jgi:peptidoglycan hydrolase-like protein with peptidoglycan-binding domain